MTSHFLYHESMLCVLIRIAASKRNIPFSKNHPKLSQICSYEIFPKGLKNDYGQPWSSVFEPLKFYCI